MYQRFITVELCVKLFFLFLISIEKYFSRSPTAKTVTKTWFAYNFSARSKWLTNNSSICHMTGPILLIYSKWRPLGMIEEGGHEPRDFNEMYVMYVNDRVRGSW